MEHKCKKTYLKTVEKCELNAEQIKKALGYCKSPKLKKCDGCPREKEDGHCMYRLNEDALALITSQEQRIKELTEENDRLKSPRYIAYSDGRIEMIPSVESVRSDTVRKMHSLIKERCIKGGIYPAYVAGTIDQIAKMLEGDTNERI